jgi:hypothetical protein
MEYPPHALPAWPLSRAKSQATTIRTFRGLNHFQLPGGNISLNLIKGQ